MSGELSASFTVHMGAHPVAPRGGEGIDHGAFPANDPPRLTGTLHVALSKRDSPGMVVETGAPGVLPRDMLCAGGPAVETGRSPTSKKVGCA